MGEICEQGAIHEFRRLFQGKAQAIEGRRLCGQAGPLGRPRLHESAPADLGGFANSHGGMAPDVGYRQGADGGYLAHATANWLGHGLLVRDRRVQ